MGLAQSLEDILAQMTEYQALLATKERDPIPHDLKVVDELLKEHQVGWAGDDTLSLWSWGGLGEGGPRGGGWAQGGPGKGGGPREGGPS